MASGTRVAQRRTDVRLHTVLGHLPTGDALKLSERWDCTERTIWYDHAHNRDNTADVDRRSLLGVVVETHHAVAVRAWREGDLHACIRALREISRVLRLDLVPDGAGAGALRQAIEEAQRVAFLTTIEGDADGDTDRNVGP